MALDDEVRAERARLEHDVALRHRLQSVGELDDLRIRLQDVVEDIALSLAYEADRVSTNPPHPQRMAWKERATRALARYRLALTQVERRRDMLERQQK